MILLYLSIQLIVIVQSLSRVRLFTAPRTAARQAPLSATSQSLLTFMSTESVMPSNHLSLCHPLLLLLSAFPSIRGFSRSGPFASGGQNIEGPASASVFLMNIQGRFPSGLTDLISSLSKGHARVQDHNLKESAPQCSSFFMAQLLHLYMTTGETTALTV